MKTLSAVVLAAATLACGGSTSTPTPSPTPTPTALGTFAILSASPAAGGSITLPVSPGDGVRSPTLEFQFTSPRDLTLGVGNTNFQVALRRAGTECLATQIAYSTRLDRNDGVYVANSAARFRTGFWVIRDIAAHRCGLAFTTDQVVFNLGQDFETTVNTGWSFVVR
jgi:hypothetical protein